MTLAAAFLILTFAASLSLLSLGPASASRSPLLFSSSMGGGGGMQAGEEKVRLGSSPPSCRNKCYDCSPCVAVQVPSLTAPSGPATTARSDVDGAAARGEVTPPLVTLSEYKPLWWKCQCRDRLYEP